MHLTVLRHCKGAHRKYKVHKRQHPILLASSPMLSLSLFLPCCSGTGALKSGFTRTGKRTIGGILDDGVKSVTRYYVNNFQDGTKQDALDLVTGGESGGRE